MTRLDEEYRRCGTGMIDSDLYRSLGVELRRGSRRRLLAAAVNALRRYFRLPQKRWMRRQASSRSSVFVA
jgi:hypothetical protein